MSRSPVSELVEFALACFLLTASAAMLGLLIALAVILWHEWRS